jgi:protein disulfide-isomerase
MKRYFGLLLTLLVYSHVGTLHAAEDKIQWLDNYETAVNLAKSQSKPLLLFFTGSNWCGYCMKLKREVFDTPQFAKAIRNNYIFLKVDFPRDFSLSPQVTAQNDQLDAKFNVRSTYPTVILFDAQQMRQMGEPIQGYSGGPQAFLNSLDRITNQYGPYKEKMQQMDQKVSFSGLELKQLYEKAVALNFENDSHRIMRVGLESDQKLFFQIEQYRFLASEGRLHDPETLALRETILAADPSNTQKIHYEIAFIDYDATRAVLESDGYCPEQAVEPLLAYIKKFGMDDKENLWRLEMIISEVFLECDEFRLALQHAEESRKVAPTTVQPEISIAIKNIESFFAQPFASSLN